MISLSLLWNGSIVGEAALSFDGCYFPLESVYFPPAFVMAGTENVYTGSFTGWFTSKPSSTSVHVDTSLRFSYTAGETDEAYLSYIDNVRMIVNGAEYHASYNYPGADYYLFDFDLKDVSSLTYFTLLFDLHRIPASSRTFINNLIIDGGNSTTLYNGYIKSEYDLKSLLMSSTNGLIQFAKGASSYYTAKASSKLENFSSSTIVSSRSATGSFQHHAVSLPSGSLTLTSCSMVLTPYVTTMQVTDTQQNQLTQQQTEQQHQDAQDQLSESQKQTAIQEEQKETTKGIFGKISDFFAGFFDGITKSLLGLFVPDDDYFSDFFARLNTFFEEKLGMLYTPIGLFVDLLSALGNASGEFAGIRFPGIKWEDTYLIEPQLVNFTVIPGLQEKIYFITDVIMVGGILWLLQIKMKEVLSG